MHRHVIILTFLALSLLIAACGGDSPSTPIGDAVKGEQLFNSGGNSGIPCTTCHTLDGSALVGPSLQGVSERAGDRIEGFTAEQYIRQSILSPSSYLVEGFSDAMNKTYPDTLSEEDVNNLIAFLLTQ